MRAERLAGIVGKEMGGADRLLELGHTEQQMTGEAEGAQQICHQIYDKITRILYYLSVVTNYRRKKNMPVIRYNPFHAELEEFPAGLRLFQIRCRDSSASRIAAVVASGGYL